MVRFFPWYPGKTSYQDFIKILQDLLNSCKILQEFKQVWFSFKWKYLAHHCSGVASWLIALHSFGILALLFTLWYHSWVNIEACLLPPNCLEVCISTWGQRPWKCMYYPKCSVCTCTDHNINYSLSHWLEPSSTINCVNLCGMQASPLVLPKYVCSQHAIELILVSNEVNLRADSNDLSPMCISCKIFMLFFRFKSKLTEYNEEIPFDVVVD